MSLDNYTNLQDEIANWLARNDLSGDVPTFITLAEAEMKRRLRRTSTRTTLSISSEATTLPADVAELRTLYLESSSPTQDGPIPMVTPEMFAETRARGGAVVGRPVAAMVLGRTLYVAPAPDQTYTARIIYFTQLTPLSVSVASNAVLVEAPDAYLYGPLIHAEGFLEHDERMATWQSKFDSAIDQLNLVRESEEYHASIRNLRLPVVLG